LISSYSLVKEILIDILFAWHFIKTLYVDQTLKGLSDPDFAIQYPSSVNTNRNLNHIGLHILKLPITALYNLNIYYNVAIIYYQYKIP
jgi:hypothetical protein